MSLLLDALKKAADDKEKNKNSPQNEIPPSKEETPVSDNLDLELEMDDFPEVDEGLTKKQQAVNEITDLNNQDEKLSQFESEDLVEPEEDILEKELAEYDSIGEIDDVEAVQTPEQTSQVEQAEIVVQEEPRRSMDVSGDDRRRPSPAKLDSTIQMDAEALDALINKSNNQSKNSKTKRTILYSVVIVLLLLGTSLYFFLEVTQSTESIYTAGTTTQQQAEYIQRNNEEEVVPEIQEPVAAKQVNVVPQVSKAKPKQTQAVKLPKKEIAPEKKVTIIYKKVEDPTDLLLQRAYQAFNDGDYSTSKDLYETVLEKENKNKDALLGVAAVAVKEQRFEYAKQRYLQLLYLDPKDSYAKAGLSTIESQQNLSLSESQLKLMLREQPNAAHLHFALGSLYASNENWPEAQAEFFNAWTSDNKNPDYAFNLAVCLDQMDKPKQAVELYQLSIKLSETGNGNFAKEDVQNRIKVLMDAKAKVAN